MILTCPLHSGRENDNVPNILCPILYHMKKISPSNQAFLTLLNTISIPKILFRALKIKKWRQAMRVEMETLKKNKAWEIVELLRGKSPVGCKLVYTIKYKSNRLLERYKCSLWSGLP